MKKSFHFISGLPRSGATLLSNVLAQNPAFHVPASTGILDIMFLIRNNWDKIPEFHQNPNPAAKLRVLQGALDAYYADKEAEIIFDRSRSWLAHIEMAEAVLGQKVKILVPVRDLRDVLASFEKLHRKASATMQDQYEEPQYLEFQSLANRTAFWSRNDQIVGLAYTRVKDAMARGFDDRMLFVPYEKFTSKPRAMMEQIYDFLDVEYFKHDFSNVEQKIPGDDKVDSPILKKIEPQEPQWQKVLGEEVAKPYAGLDFWNK